MEWSELIVEEMMRCDDDSDETEQQTTRCYIHIRYDIPRSLHARKLSYEAYPPGPDSESPPESLRIALPKHPSLPRG